MNNKYEDLKSGQTIFYNTRKVVTSANKEKPKRKIYFYYVSSDDRRERPEIS
jgi:hypothetical protein